MENIKQKAETLTDHVTDYMETYFKLTVLKATDKAAGVASSSLAAILLAVFGLFVLLFASIGAGWWIGQALDNMVAGFCIVAGFYALLAIVVIALRKNVITPMVRNIIIKSAYE